MITKLQAIKKQLAIVEQEEKTSPKECQPLRALLENLARDLLTVEQYEQVLKVELIEH